MSLGLATPPRVAHHNAGRLFLERLEIDGERQQILGDRRGNPVFFDQYRRPQIFIAKNWHRIP